MPAPDATSTERSRRGQGQWAHGHREPLTANERFKKDDDGLNVRARVANIYSKAGFASINPSDLRGRLRWWGLYTQRRPGIDGGRTALLEPHELDDEFFMLRRRLEAVGLSTTEARGDTPRVLLGSPVAGIAADEIIDGTPAIDAILERYVGNPE